jgi:hypothetical protein
MEGYSQDGEFSQSQGQAWSQNSPWMSYSQPQFQPISPQMHVSNFDHFGTGSPRYFMPLGMPPCNGSDLQPSSEEVTPSSNARNYLMDMKKEEAIRAAVKALNGEDVPVVKKRGRPPKGGKTNATAKKKKMEITTKKATKEVVNLAGSDSEEENASRKWRDYEVETLISIRGEMEEEFSRCTKKQGLYMCFIFWFYNFLYT